MVDWPMLREDPNVMILFSGAKQLKEWVDKMHGMGYLIAGNYLSISLSPDLWVGISQSASLLVVQWSFQADKFQWPSVGSRADNCQ